MKYKHYSIVFILVLCAVAVGYGLAVYSQPERIMGNVERRFNSGSLNRFTNPLLECNESLDLLLPGDRVRIEKNIKSYVDSSTASGNILHASVYFRDLNNGPWFGINEKEYFTPSSLLKLPLVMSVYKEAQKNPSIFDRTINHAPSQPQAIENNFGSDISLSTGTYTVRELIDRTLENSNNDAAVELANILGIEKIQTAYVDLGLEAPRLGGDYQIQVKNMGAFFRILYNASYLGQDYSEEILSTLTKSTFRDGLVAGVPNNILVAHKFGTRSIEGTQYVQLHDCGIVYEVKTPYVLCVMSQGTDLKSLTSFIQGVSSRVYKGISELGK